MQTFTTHQSEAMKYGPALSGKADDDWKMIVDGQRFDVSDGYDLNRPDNLYSLYCKVRMLTGSDWMKNHPDVPLDRIQITRWSPDTCDCTTTFTWDRSSTEEAREHHPHRGEKHCSAHVHLKGNCNDHCNELLAENQHKNLTIHTVAQSMQAKYARDNRGMLIALVIVSGGIATEDQILEMASRNLMREIRFEHKERRGKRMLHLSHAEFNDPHVRGEVSVAISSCPHASKRECHIVTG